LRGEAQAGSGVVRIRREIALTCASHREFEEEVAYLNRYVGSGGAKNEENRETITGDLRLVDESHGGIS
jgi:hypothetical protein